MAHLNPFLHQVDESLDSSGLEEGLTSDAPYKLNISLESIAEELLKKQFILTALEFHTEIQERGREVNRLSNYFSNPSNFEQQITSKDGYSANALYRTGSCSTFDSLDITRYSDDGAGQVDEKVAVLEFELRKARDTIKSLRENLTRSAEQGTSCLHENANSNNASCELDDITVAATEIKPLEVRAINHLINEYLLQRGYKLSSITFADENEAQDFEDWDDVGINTPKPPGLLKLYRDYHKHTVPQHAMRDASTNTVDALMVVENEHLIKELENEVACLKEEKNEFELALKSLRENEEQLKNSMVNKEAPKTSQSDFSKVPDDISKVSDDVRKVPDDVRKVPDDVSKVPDDVSKVPDDVRKVPDDVSKVPDDVSKVPGDVSDEESVFSCKPDLSRMSSLLWNSLLRKCQPIAEFPSAQQVTSGSSNSEELVNDLSRLLPQIVPTVLIAKRGQLIPLLLSCAALHRNLNTRIELLHILFNLIKKPDTLQRATILRGCVNFAKHVGVDRSEEELLPQFWEQIGHKYSERRQLVAEACGLVAPYLRPEIRSSLLLSIIHQMEQEEKREDIRCSIVRSHSLVYSFIDEDDKYRQGLEILEKFLKDRNKMVRDEACRTLLPSMAAWSMSRRSLHLDLADRLLWMLETFLSSSENGKLDHDRNAPILHLMPYLFVSVLHETCDIGSKQLSHEECRHIKVDDVIDHPSLIIGDEDKFTSFVKMFDEVISSSPIDASHEVLLWATHQLVPRLLKVGQDLDVSWQETIGGLVDLFALFQELFGRNFFLSKVTPQFMALLQDPNNLATAIFPVFTAAVLPAGEESSLSDFLLNSIVDISKSNLPLTSLFSSFILLRSNEKWHDVILQVLWSALVHDSALVRASAASLFAVLTTTDVSVNVISTRIVPALITLSTDHVTNVRISSIKSLSSLAVNSDVTSEIVERVIAQLTELVSSSVETFYEEHSQDGTLLGLHSVQTMLIAMATDMGATAHPKFRDEYLLPHLAIIALNNNRMSDVTKRSIIAHDLLEAYSGLSCCFVSGFLLHGSVLPALKCLLLDLEYLQSNQLTNATSLINEVERKIDQGSVTSQGSMDSVKRDPSGKSRLLHRLFDHN
ncbi:RAB11-binding protein RELCH-like isoform X2 [Clavelina lepadiformis]|uniref:RAB11-binding protein RELCH-like isoform X2 n=1 Tax=Clavelina lepadiformis TaxID=159417 RepID=UPI00404200AE